MPSKYTVRSFRKDGYYHIYNSGAEKRLIFLDDEDYNTFYYYLFVYTTPLEKSARRYKEIPFRLAHKNLSGQVTLLSYCLMPNHFHLLLQQKSLDGMSRLMKQLTNAYTQYFNDKYDHEGRIFSGRYKSVDINNLKEAATISRFIHLKPILTGLSNEPEYRWSSYNEFADPTPRSLSSPEKILEQFASIYAYKKYVQDLKGFKKELPKIQPLIIETQ